MIIQVPANVAEDTGGNPNIASDAHTVSVDLPPTVVISDVPTDIQSGAFNITITFSENVTGFTETGIELTPVGSATVTDLVEINEQEYTAEITPVENTEGEVVIQVPADVAQDSAGNGNTVSQSHTVSVDLVRPSVEITGIQHKCKTTPLR